jgi:hypothetical protein
MCVALARGLLLLPAALFAGAIAWLAFRSALGRGSAPPEAFAAVVAAASSPRALSIAMGLWLAGWVLWGALRVAWVAGSLPILARRMAGPNGPIPAFSAGLAYRFAPALGAALVAAVLDALGQGLLLAVAAGALALLPRTRASASPGAVAAVVAAAAASAAFLAASLSALGDAAVARAATAGEPVGRAVARAASRFARRPAAFVAAVMAVWLGAALAMGSLQSAGSLLAGVAARAPPPLLAVPELLLGALSAMLAAAAELWALATLAVLALGGEGDPGPPAGPPR